MQVSYSRISCFQSCRRRYYWSYVEGYRPLARAIGQSAGDAGHRALAFWYTNNRDIEGAIAVAQGVLVEDPKKSAELEQVLRRYFAWASGCDDFEMLAAEKEFKIPLTDGNELYGITDGILKRRDGTVWLLENKFLKQATTSHLGLDRQCSIYLLGFQELKPSGVLYNVIRMAGGPAALKEPALRDYTFRSQYAIELTRRELCCIARDIAKYEALPSNQMLLESYANPTRDCNWSCSFHGVCLGLYDSGDQSALKTQFTKIRDGKPQVSAVTRNLDVDV